MCFFICGIGALIVVADYQLVSKGVNKCFDVYPACKYIEQ